MLLVGSAPDRDGVSVKPSVSRSVLAAALASLAHACLTSVFLLAAPAVHAMTFGVTTTSVDAPGAPARVAHEIRATGSFERGDTDQLAAILQGIKGRGGTRPGDPLAVIAFDSRGGVLEEGMRMGRLLRQHGAATLVRTGNRCLSACALAFLGGSKLGSSGAEPSRWLEIGGQLGFHAFYAARDVDARDASTSRARGVTEGRAMSAVIISYVIEMGIEPAVVLRALVRPPDEMTFVETAGEFGSLGICPVGLSLPRATLAERAAHVCSNASQGHLPAWPDLVNEYTPMEARRLLLGQVAHDAGQAKVRAGVATRLQQVLRGGKGTEAIYDELAAAGLPLPVMRARAYFFEVPGAGAGRASCLVTLSPGGPADYGVVLITSAGLAAPRLAAPAGCPELHLFGHDEVLNARALALADRD
jgi:hypothetical protein